MAILGFLLVSVSIFNGIQTSNATSYLKAATAILVTFMLLLSLRRNSDSNPEAIIAGKRNIKMVAAGLAIGIILPLIFLWLVKLAVR